MTPRLKSLSSLLLTSLYFTLFSISVYAQSFGQFDSRGIAMGGTTVSNANTAQAPFYNPALLSSRNEYEEYTANGRFMLPLISAKVSESVFDIDDYASGGGDQALSDAINAFNTTINAQTARDVVSTANDMISILNSIESRPLDADVYGGVVISEPSKREGGAFFLGVRALAGGNVNITDEDRALLNSYIDTLTFISTNGQSGTLRPELFDNNGNLIDNSGNLSSSYRGRGATIVEAGVSFAKEVLILSYPVSLGVSPKLWIVDTYDSTGNLRDGVASTSTGDQQTDFSGNMDLGAAAQLTEYWQFGLAVKDIFTQTYDTGLGGTIKIEPKARLGGAYVRDLYQFALDVDLNKTDPFATRQTTQDISLGTEWQVISQLFLRAGYRHDIQSVRADEASVGVGFQWRRILFDFGYAQGRDSRAASLQFGYIF